MLMLRKRKVRQPIARFKRMFRSQRFSAGSHPSLARGASHGVPPAPSRPFFGMGRGPRARGASANRRVRRFPGSPYRPESPIARFAQNRPKSPVAHRRTWKPFDPLADSNQTSRKPWCVGYISVATRLPARSVCCPYLCAACWMPEPPSTLRASSASWRTPGSRSDLRSRTRATAAGVSTFICARA